MTVDVTLQVRGMCQAVLIGGGLGVVYDLMRVLRRRLPVPGLAGTLDFLFWILATVVLFLFSHRTWGGEIRLYGAAFCLAGGAAYFWGISPLVLKVAFTLADLIRLVLGIFTVPLRLVERLFKRIVKIAKNTFLSGKNGV